MMTSGKYVDFLIGRKKSCAKSIFQEIANLKEFKDLEKKVDRVDTPISQIKNGAIKEKEISELGKCCDYLNAIIALAECSDFQEREKCAIKTLAIECCDTLTKLKEK